MGWISGADTNGQVRIDFDDKDAAIAFARTHAIPHQVIDAPEAARQIKSYSDNFAFRKLVARCRTIHDAMEFGRGWALVALAQNRPRGARRVVGYTGAPAAVAGKTFGV